MKRYKEAGRRYWWFPVFSILCCVTTVISSFALEPWGDIPADELSKLTPLDFIKGTPEEAKTLAILELLKVDPKRRMLAVIYRGSNEQGLSDKEKGVKIIMEGKCAIELAPISRKIIDYRGIGRTDLPQPTEIEFSEMDKGKAEALARSLGNALDYDLSDVETRTELKDGVWDINFYQLYKGFLCPSNVFTVTINANSMTVRNIVGGNFITTANTDIKITKESAVTKACQIAKSNFPAFKEKSTVKGSVSIDKPWIYPVAVERDEQGQYVGLVGRLAWPVYLDDSMIVIYIDCESGEMLSAVE